MSGVDHEHAPQIEQAARWLAENRQSLARAIVPYLRTTFDLSAKQACEACRRAFELRRAA